MMFLITSGLLAQNYVSTQPQDKNAILEEFTGVRCSNCPAGHQTAASILSNNPGRAFCVAYHPSNSNFTAPYPGDPDFRRTYPNAFYSTPYCGSSRFMPSAFINRRLWSGERISERVDWTSRCNTIMSEASPANVGLSTTYDFAAQMLYITVEIYYTADMTDANHVYVLLSENDLVSQQSGASGPYTHKHTFREAFVGQWGDVITDPTTQGSLVTLEYSWNATGSGYIMGNCEVLAFIENQATGEVITGAGVDVGDQTYTEPTAGFSADDITVGVGGEATFTDESEGTPTEWEWTFDGGDPATSNLQEPPPITYDTPGQYSVTLAVSNPTGSDTITMTNYIDVDYAPVADFSASQTLILEGEGVTFTDLSTYSPTEWAWIFEGGTPDQSNQQAPPEIIYNTPGIYYVSLTAINEYGADVLLKTEYIHVGDLGIDEEANMKAFSVYPNPSSGKLFIEARGTESVEQIIVRNVGGQAVLSHYPAQSLLQTLDLSELEAGLYFVEMRTEGKVYLEKIVVE